MNSHPLSDGKIFHLGGFRVVRVLWSGLIVLCLGLQLGCSSGQGKADAGLVEGEVSLIDDRSQVNELRKDVPTEVRRENDELAEFLSLMGEVRLPPSRVRSDFQKVVRKRRKSFRRNLRKTRDSFSRQEQKKRKAFLSMLKKERASIKRQDLDRKVRDELYREVSTKRKDFFADEREKRRDFESEVRAQSREFDSEMREKNRAFNEQLRDYRKRYNQLKKQKRDEKRNKKKSRQSVRRKKTSPSSSLKELAEFEEMRSVPATPLATEDN